MLKKTKETKVFRDVIHNYIHVDLQVVWDLINAKEFQRLRRIHQLGGAYEVYHTAEHSRFSHSLGVYETIRRMVYEVDDLNKALGEFDKASIMIAGLLHDIGHLPFSHSFEHICPISHEEFSVRIILGDTDINKILTVADPGLARDVADIIEYKHHNQLLNQLLSGQLDADRMDYLLRDAYFTGTSYGKFDLERVMRTIRVKGDKLVVKQSGVYSVENYILARYHMYWQVYYHPVCRSFEMILAATFKRLRYLHAHHQDPAAEVELLLPFLGDNPSIADHYNLDETVTVFVLSKVTRGKDAIAADLAQRILNRRLFTYRNINDKDELATLKEVVKRNGYNPDYYCLSDKAAQSPYKPYDSSRGHNIYVLKENGKVEELSKQSDIVAALVKGKMQEDWKAFYPKDIK